MKKVFHEFQFNHPHLKLWSNYGNKQLVLICNSFKKELFEGTHNFKQSGGNSFKLSLYTNSAVLGKSTTSFTTDVTSIKLRTVY